MEGGMDIVGIVLKADAAVPSIGSIIIGIVCKLGVETQMYMLSARVAALSIAPQGEES